MEISEMRNCFTETFNYFIEVMPNAPFARDDIIVEFAPHNQMAERAMALCAICVSNKDVCYCSALQLAQNSFADSIIGYEKSAVLAFRDPKESAQEWHKTFFHELTHIFCTHYYSFTKPLDRAITTVDAETAEIKWLLSRVKPSCADTCNGAFSFACAKLLACSDIEEFLLSGSVRAICARQKFWDCLSLLRKHMENEKPWKIDKEFIETLGKSYIDFRDGSNVKK